ncbi:antibiotic biosynthesis monooxygenase [Mycoplasmopsis felis]|uniref:antibiotic biosynthesis monooxygenase n=1 Tax=Mycoplasmopsis felis TaxID=33923 RepID=UPI002AFE2F64|nr:antibiotic biosynthesis monooxygenase [Mycoplasmopsis felis]WQQ06721.1 antibiotic biosynthesis monooxygenase [Mycoplasmopsis felis]
MIYSKTTKFIVPNNKLKEFLEILKKIVNKIRIQETNLSFEYGLEKQKNVLLIERWSTKEDFHNFYKKQDIIDDFKSLENNCLKFSILFELEIKR